MTAIVPRFSVARYRLSLRPRETLHVPACNKGTMLRGAFGYAFKAMACSFTSSNGRSPCRECCQLSDTCPYGILFETSPPPGAARLRLNQDEERLAATTRLRRS